jgi:hypothetical protein
VANVKAEYGGIQTLAITLASLAATAARESATVDNTTTKYLDALLQVKVKTDVTAPGNDKALYVYAWGVADPTTPTYPDTVTGADAAITLNDPTQLRLIGVVSLQAASTTYKSEPLSVASAFGGVLPPKWGVVVRNSASALTAVGGDHAVTWNGLYQTVV